MFESVRSSIHKLVLLLLIRQEKTSRKSQRIPNSFSTVLYFLRCAVLNMK